MFAIRQMKADAYCGRSRPYDAALGEEHHGRIDLPVSEDELEKSSSTRVALQSLRATLT
jgi:hypothetical protein